MAKMMRLQWTQDLDIETLEARVIWATVEMLEVVTYHLPRYENIVKTYKTSPGQLNPSDLTFATKFVARHLFVHQGKGVPSYDVSVFDRGHGQCRKGKRGIH